MKRRVVFLSCILVAVVVVATIRLERCNDDTPWTYRLHMLDVGQGDSILIELGGDRQLLIDGGPDATVLSELGAILPPGDRTIEYVALTHPHADHAMGLLHVLDRYTVETVLTTGVPYASPVYDALKAAIDREGAVVIPPDEATTWIDAPINVSVLYPTAEMPVVKSDNINETSLVLLVDDGGHPVLLMGDAGEDVEEAIKNVLRDVTVLKVGHQGSRTSSSRAFLGRVQPDIALISVGEDNEYHHPHSTVLKRLADVGAHTYRTDQDGRITVTSFPDGINVQTGARGWTERLLGAILSSNHVCHL